MPWLKYVIAAIFATISILKASGRVPQYKTPYLASLRALEDLKLDSIQNSTDSLAVRLLAVDSTAGRIVVYDLHYTQDKTISLIYWAEAKKYSRKRFFGLVSPKVWYSPLYQIGMLYPYQKVDDIISFLPHCSSTESVANTQFCTSVMFNIGGVYSETLCCNDGCSCADDLQRFFDTYFYYQKD